MCKCKLSEICLGKDDCDNHAQNRAAGSNALLCVCEAPKPYRPKGICAPIMPIGNCFNCGKKIPENIDEKESIYRCGWCGFPTDDKGQPLEMDNDAAYEYIEKHKDDVNVSVNGHCCANEQH